MHFPRYRKGEGVANVVTGQLAQATLTLTARAIKLLGQTRSAPTIFCDTETEARAWIDAQRVAFFLKHPGAQR